MDLCKLEKRLFQLGDGERTEIDELFFARRALRGKLEIVINKLSQQAR